MTETRALATPGLGVPAIDLRTIATMLVAGAVATIAFDFFGQALAPMLGFANLAPVPLATQV